MDNENTLPTTQNSSEVAQLKQRIVKLTSEQRSRQSFKREIHSIQRQLRTISNPRTAIRLILSYFDVKCRPPKRVDGTPPSVCYWKHMEEQFAELIAQCGEQDYEWIIEQFLEIVSRQNLHFVQIFEEAGGFLPNELMNRLGQDLMQRYFVSEFAQSEQDIVVSVMVSRLGEMLNDVEMFYAARRYGQQGQLQLLDYIDLFAIFGRRGDVQSGLRAAEQLVEKLMPQPAMVMFLAESLLAEGSPLVAVYALQSLVKHLIQLGTKQSQVNAANYLVLLDEVSPRIQDWLNVVPHQEFVARLRTQHGHRQEFWDSYERGHNKNVAGYSLNIYI